MWDCTIIAAAVGYTHPTSQLYPHEEQSNAILPISVLLCIAASLLPLKYTTSFYLLGMIAIRGRRKSGQSLAGVLAAGIVFFS